MYLNHADFRADTGIDVLTLDQIGYVAGGDDIDWHQVVVDATWGAAEGAVMGGITGAAGGAAFGPGAVVGGVVGLAAGAWAGAIWGAGSSIWQQYYGS